MLKKTTTNNNSYMPQRIVPFIGSVTNKILFDQLNDFFNNQNEKTLVIRNHESISEQSGVGKKSFLVEYCLTLLKTKFIINWISAKSDSTLMNELKKYDFNKKMNFLNSSFKLKDLFIFYDANESDLIEKYLSKIFTTNKKIIIISNSAFFRLNKFKASYLEFIFDFSIQDFKFYFSFFPETKYLNLNELIQVIPKQKPSPFLLKLLVKFIKYNHLIPFSELFEPNDKFDLNFLFNFLNNLNRISFEICKVFAYVDHECVPKELLKSIFQLSMVQMQIPLNILTCLGILEKFSHLTNLYFKMNEYFLTDLKSYIISNESLDDEMFLKLKIGKSLYKLTPCIQKRDFNKFIQADFYFSSMENFLNSLDFKDLSVFEDNFTRMLIDFLHKFILYSYNNKKDNPESLIKYSRIHYELIKKKGADEHICEVIKSGNFLATVYFDNGFYNEALTIYNEVNKFNSLVYASDSLEVAKNIFKIGNCYLKIYYFSLALYSFKDSLNIQLKLLGDRIDSEIADTIFLIGICYLKIDNIKKAYLYHKRAYLMRVKLFGNRSIKTADSMNFLGECNFKMNIYKEAKTFYEKSYLFRLQIVGNKDPNLVDTLINLAQVLIAIKEYKKCSEILNKKIDLSNLDSLQSIKVSYLKGLYLMNSGQINEALIYLFDGFYNYSYSKQLDKEIKLNILNCLAESLNKVGNKSKYEEYASQAKILNEEINAQKISDKLDEMRSWTKKIVCDWLSDNNLNRNIIDLFEEINGQKLVDYYNNPKSYSIEIDKKLAENELNSKLKITKEDCDDFFQILENYITR